MPRFGTGGGVLLTLGRLTEETPDWEELESKEVELTDREGPVGGVGLGAGLVEETLSGTSGSVERERHVYSGVTRVCRSLLVCALTIAS